MYFKNQKLKLTPLEKKIAFDAAIAVDVTVAITQLTEASPSPDVIDGVEESVSTESDSYNFSDLSESEQNDIHQQLTDGLESMRDSNESSVLDGSESSGTSSTESTSSIIDQQTSIRVDEQENESVNLLLYEMNDDGLELIDKSYTPLNITSVELISNETDGITLNFTILNDEGIAAVNTLSIDTLSFIVSADADSPVIILAIPSPDDAIQLFQEQGIQIGEFVFTQWGNDVLENKISDLSLLKEEGELQSSLSSYSEISKSYAFVNIDSVDSFTGIDDLFVMNSEVKELRSPSYSYLITVQSSNTQSLETLEPLESSEFISLAAPQNLIVSSTIPDVIVDEDAENVELDLSDYFGDSAGTITYTVENNSNLVLVDYSISNSLLTLDFLDNQNGQAQLLIRATDSADDSFVEDTLTVTVNAIPDPPVVSNPIANFSVNEDAQNTVIDLSTVFTDPDTLNNGDILTYSVITNTNPNLVSTSLNGGELIIEYLDNQNGEVTIIIQAQDLDGNTALEGFTLSVDPVSDNPIVENSIGDFSVGEDSSDTFIDLTSVFSDADVLTDNDQLTFELVSNDNTDLMNVSINGSILSLNYLEDKNGEASIVVRATDSEANFIEESFIVTVDPVSDNPIVVNPFEDFSVDEDAVNAVIDLDNVFDDVDILTNGETLTYQIINNTNENLVNATINGSELTLDFLENQNGQTTIVIQATDSEGNMVLDGFEATVTPIADPPSVENPINDFSVDEDSADMVINLDNVFTDPDISLNNDSIIYEIISNTNENLVSVSLLENELMLGYAENQNGESAIIVRATDGDGNFIEESFTVTVNAIADRPVIISRIPGVMVNEDSSDFTIDLSQYFDDIDIQTNGDNLVYSTDGISDSNLVSNTVVGGELILSFQENQFGQTSERINATDSSGLSVWQAFSIVIRSVPDDPIVQDPIGSVTVDEDSPSTVIDLDTVFDDIDIDTNGDFLTYELIGNSNQSLVTASIFENELTLDYQENQNGISTITIMATDSFGLTVSEIFNVVVNPVSDLPYIVNPIANFIVAENSGDTFLDLSQVFSDIDISTNEETLSYQVIGNTNASLVSTSINGDELTLSYQQNSTGKAVVDVRVTDSEGNFVDDSFIVTVGPEVDPPVVQNAISDFSVTEDSGDTVIDLNNVFSDDSPLTYQVFTNSNPELVNAQIIGNELRLSYAANLNGQSSVQIEALDSDLNSILISFTVTVDSDPDTPVVNNPITDFSVIEDSESTEIDLDHVFSDIDIVTNTDSLTYQVVGNTNQTLISTTIDANVLTLDYLENQNGDASITIRAVDSNGLFTDHAFSVTVNPINDGPILENPIRNFSIVVGGSAVEIDLDTVFTDPDIITNNDELSYQIINPSLINASINNNILSLSSLNGNTGDFLLRVRAYDQDGVFTQNNFILTVTSDPIVSSPIGSVIVNEDASDTTIDLDNVFDDNGELTYQVLSNSNTDLVGASINGNELTLEYFENQNGSADIVIQAIDSEGTTVEDAFQVVVDPVADTPILENPIDTIEVEENANSTVIDLDAVFSDVDIQTNGDSLTYTVFVNTNENLVFATVNGNGLILDYQENQSGTATIIIQATDSEFLSIQEGFEVIVNPLSDDQPPQVENPIDDFQVQENSVNTVIDLDSVFSDVGELTYEVVFNNNLNLVNASINGNLLTLEYSENQSGQVFIVIKATDSENNSSQDSFEVVVIPEVSGGLPFVENPIDDFQVPANSDSTLIDLNTVFSSDDPLAYTVYINTNSGLVEASIDGSELTLDYITGQKGEATIIIEAQDHKGNSVQDVFTVTVETTTSDLSVVRPIGDITVNEDASPTSINIDDVFSSSNSLTYQIVFNNGPSIVNAYIVDNVLNLEFLENQNGEAYIAVEAFDQDGNSIQDVFKITILSVPDIPIIDSQLPDITINSGVTLTEIDISSYVTSLDGDVANLSYSIATNTNSNLISATMNGSILTLVTSGSEGGSTSLVLSISSSLNTVAFSNLDVIVVPPFIPTTNPSTEAAENPEPTSESDPEATQDPEENNDSETSEVEEADLAPVEETESVQQEEAKEVASTFVPSSQLEEREISSTATFPGQQESSTLLSNEFKVLGSSATFSSYSDYKDLGSVFSNIEGSKLFHLKIDNADYAELFVVPEEIHERSAFNFAIEEKANLATVGESAGLAFSGFNISYIKLRMDSMIALLGEYINRSKITLQAMDNGLPHQLPAFIIKLDRKPTSTVEMKLSFSIDNIGIITPNVLTFTPENWDKEQRVEFLINDSEKAFSNVVVNVHSDDPYYNKIDINQLSFQNEPSIRDPIVAIPLSTASLDSEVQSISISFFVNDAEETDINVSEEIEHYYQDEYLDVYLQLQKLYEKKSNHIIEYNFTTRFFIDQS